MTKYLLTCGCGNSVPVDVGQAGERIECHCGAALEVPPLRKLRHLPVARPEPEIARSKWSARQGIVATLVILATVLGCVALWNRLTEPAVAKFNPVTRAQRVEHGLENLTPLQAWQLWIEVYRPLAERGFVELVDPHAPVIEQQVAERRFLQRVLVLTAVVLIAIAAAVALWPSGTRTRRQRDKAN